MASFTTGGGKHWAQFLSVRPQRWPPRRACWPPHGRHLRSTAAPATALPPLRSTLIENTQGNSVSEDFSVRTWPWDMGNGFPINCDW